MKITVTRSGRPWPVDERIARDEIASGDALFGRLALDGQLWYATVTEDDGTPLWAGGNASVLQDIASAICEAGGDPQCLVGVLAERDEYRDIAEAGAKALAAIAALDPESWAAEAIRIAQVALDPDMAPGGAEPDAGATKPAGEGAGTPEAPEAPLRAAGECRGFRWIGQSFASCDGCGKPAWEHDGILQHRAGTPLSLGGDNWELRPWAPGEAEARKRKWGQS